MQVVSGFSVVFDSFRAVLTGPQEPFTVLDPCRKPTLSLSLLQNLAQRLLIRSSALAHISPEGRQISLQAKVSACCKASSQDALRGEKGERRGGERVCMLMVPVSSRALLSALV